jgi:hypothetical protein
VSDDITLEAWMAEAARENDRHAFALARINEKYRVKWQPRS